MVSKNKKKIQRDAHDVSDVSDVVTIESVNSTRTAYACGTRENFTILNVTNVTNVTTNPKREGNEVYSSKAAKRKLEAHEEEARSLRRGSSSKATTNLLP